MDRNTRAQHLLNQASFDPEDEHISDVPLTEKDVNEKIFKWARECGIRAHVFENEYFKSFMDAISQVGPGYVLPTPEELRTTLLTSEFDTRKEKLKKHENEWKKYGCSILIDIWTTGKTTSIMNLCVNSRLGTVFLSTKKVPHTTQHIYEYVETCIQEVGFENVVQVVTDNVSDKMGAKKLLKEKKPTIFWTPCATRTINLMLEGISDLPMFKKVLDQAKALTVFIYSHHETLKLMRCFTKKRDIVRPGVTKSASDFLTLQLLAKKKAEIRDMFSSMEWEDCEVSKTIDGKSAYETVHDSGFWTGVTLCLKVFSPLIKVLRMVDFDKKPSMGFVYGEIMNARKEITNVLGKCNKDYEGIMGIISSKMKDRLDSCLHLTAYLFNPYYHYKDQNLQHDVVVMDAVLDFFVTIFRGDLEMQHQIINVELPKYKNKEGVFGREITAKACEVNDDTFDPANWWGTFGGSTPNLRQIAMRILSLTTSSFGCDRNRTTLKREHMKEVNELTTTQMDKYVFVQFNLNLKLKKKKKQAKEHGSAIN